jgi:hypothetical protein
MHIMILSFFLDLFVVLISCDLENKELFHSVVQEWIPILDDQMAPWNSGITLELIDKTLTYPGHNVVFQHMDKKLYLYDPKRYCFCNRTTMKDTVHEYHMTRCLALGSILQATIDNAHNTLVNFELVWSLDDFAFWNNYQRSSAYLGIGAVRCWDKNTLAFPFFGSHSEWNINDADIVITDDIVTRDDIEKKRGTAIFRGGVDRGCSFERDTVVDFDAWSLIHNHSRKDCGRSLLLRVSREHPLFVDYHGAKDTFISLNNQSKLYRYVLSVEGYGGWTDRLYDLIATPDMVVMNQEHPCDLWFEPLLKPFVHYIPVAHDFRNLVGRVQWANRHLNTVLNIQSRAKLFAKKYLSKRGILDYSQAFLEMYTQRVKYHVRPREGSLNFLTFRDQRKMDEICKQFRK